MNAALSELRGEALLLRKVIRAKAGDAGSQREFQPGERLDRREHRRRGFEPRVAARSESRRVGTPVAERVFFREPAGVERALVLVARMDVEPARTGTAPRVLVRPADREVGVERGEIERQHARMVIDIEQHACARGVRGADHIRNPGNDLGVSK